MKIDDNCTLPLIGGPFDGECAIFSKGILANNLPIYHKNNFHIYKLKLHKCEKFTKISYEYTGEIVDINNVGKYKCTE